MNNVERRSYQPKTEEEEAAADRAIARYMRKYKSGLIDSDYDGARFAAIAITDTGVEVSCRYNNRIVNANIDFGVSWEDLQGPPIRKSYTDVEENVDE